MSKELCIGSGGQARQALLGPQKPLVMQHRRVHGRTHTTQAFPPGVLLPLSVSVRFPLLSGHGKMSLFFMWTVFEFLFFCMNVLKSVSILCILDYQSYKSQ